MPVLILLALLLAPRMPLTHPTRYSPPDRGGSQSVVVVSGRLEAR